MESGLYIVATPIGNMQDLTFRAIEVLKNVDLIGAEDTRHSQILLSNYGISTKMISLHDHNESNKKDFIVDFIKSGKSIALISDAGTPLISDPGYHVVSYCRSKDIRVIPIPGACAAITALCASGLPTDNFVFKGFLPVKETAIFEELSSLIDEQKTVVYYESPKRVINTIIKIIEVLGSERRIVLARELTKTFESFYDLSAGEMLQFLQEDQNRTRGEFVVMIEGVNTKPQISAKVIKTLTLLQKEISLKKAAAICADIYGLKKNELYDLGLEIQNNKKL